MVGVAGAACGLVALLITLALANRTYTVTGVIGVEGKDVAASGPCVVSAKSLRSIKEGAFIRVLSPGRKELGYVEIPAGEALTPSRWLEALPDSALEYVQSSGGSVRVDPEAERERRLRELRDGTTRENYCTFRWTIEGVERGLPFYILEIADQGSVRLEPDQVGFFHACWGRSSYDFECSAEIQQPESSPGSTSGATDTTRPIALPR